MKEETRGRKEKNTSFDQYIRGFGESESERENEREREVFDASSDARETRTSHVHPFIRPSISPRGLNADVEEIN